MQNLTKDGEEDKNSSKSVFPGIALLFLSQKASEGDAEALAVWGQLKADPIKATELAVKFYNARNS